MKTLALLLLPALALPSFAADRTGAKAQKQVEDLQQGIGRPEDFENFVQGSRTLPELQLNTGASGAAASPASRLSPLQPAPRRAPSALPPTPMVDASSLRSPKGPDSPFRDPVAWLLLGGALMIGAAYHDWGRGEESPAPAPLPDIPRWTAPRTESAPSIAGSAPEPAAETRFIDTRMPAPTWRAISLREQKLIESWNVSREKALGLASLEEWIDARALSAQVDAEVLKSKLRREA